MKVSKRFTIAMLLGALLSAAGLYLVASALRTAWLRAHRITGNTVDEGVDGSDAATPIDDDTVALKAAEPIDPKMVSYHETATFPVAFHEPRALAVDLDNRVYVAGDRGLACYSPEGKKLAAVPLGGEPGCLAVGAFDHVYPGRLYVGMGDHVEVLDKDGNRIAAWATQGPQAGLTSITTTEREVWVADAGNRIVWRYDPFGKSLGRVGDADQAKQTPGFLITSRYFDLAAGTDDLVYVVNPRLLHVEGYTLRGEYEIAWGKGSPAVADFFGCCNPAQLAVFPDGRFATAEKGIPRVKIYTREGHFETVVAGPPELSETPADLAVDRRGRVLVLDRRAAKVRVFEKQGVSKEDGK